MRIRDGKNSNPGWKKFGSGMEKIRIRDKTSRIRNTDQDPLFLSYSRLMSRIVFVKIPKKVGVRGGGGGGNFKCKDQQGQTFGDE
jgi:hypothetical protein